MKKMLLLVLSLFFWSTSLTSQTTDQRNEIIRNYDKTKTGIILKKLERKSFLRQKKMDSILTLYPHIKKKTITTEGNIKELIDVDCNGGLLYYTSYNYTSASTMQTDSMYINGSLGLNLSGKNMIAGVWDEGIALSTHREFTNDKGSKIKHIDGQGIVANHSTHVSGTIAGIGIDTLARGIAPESQIHCYNWTNDMLEMAQFAKEGYLVSNHSYGRSTNIGNAEWIYGAYDSQAVDADEIAYNFPFYQIVKAGGNNRREWARLYPAKDSYELLTGFSNSKNVLTIAAINMINFDFYPHINVPVAAFSNTGPTDDGRIKPNLSAKGLAVYSPVADSDSSYSEMNGTSMAAPAVAGGILLIQELYHNLYQSYMNSATVRGLLQHTTVQAWEQKGPNYETGWGAVNFMRASKAILNIGEGSIIEEKVLNDKEEVIKYLSVEPGMPLTVSISWTDLPGPENRGKIDWQTKSLVNDLDLTVTDESGNIYYPWKLDPANPVKAATTGDNNVDNFERIDIENPEGIYKIKISHKNTLSNNGDYKQGYTFIATGHNLKESLSSIKTDNLSLNIYPNPVTDILNISVNESFQYIFFDITGTAVKKGSLKQGINYVDVSNLNKGTYILSISNNQKTEYKKVIIK